MKRTQSPRRRLVVLGGILGLSGSLQGQVMLSPAAIADTDLTSYNATVTMTNLINQSGITTPFTSGATLFDTYFATPGQMFATSGSGGINNWQSELASGLGHQGFIDFDLGAVYRVHRLAIWNRSLSNVTVSVLRDPAGPVQDAGTFTLIDRQSFYFSYAPDMIPFAAPLEGRYVRLVINGIYPVPGFSFGYASAGEVVASASPLVATPTVSLNREPDGGVRVEFTGTLQAAATVGGSFTNLPGNPPSPFILLRENLEPVQFFRASSESP